MMSHFYGSPHGNKMCGIAGIFTLSTTKEKSDLLNAILLSQHQRGPDSTHQESIITEQYSCLLGHNRLKVIDLSSHADQPMWDRTNNYCLVYNGEVYNYLEIKKELIQLGYEFRTISDTEVLLYALIVWGMDALNKLNGPFAFSFFDKNKKTLYLVRDRFGVKPLYYHSTPREIYFASSTQALAKGLMLSPNFSYLSRGLRYGIYEDGSSETAYEKLNSLTAGTYLLVRYDDSTKISIKQYQYYNLQQRVEKCQHELANYDYQKISDNLLNTLETAVNLRLRSDVNLAMSLSGGLDSCSIAAIAAENHSKLTAFTFGSANASDSEGKLVELFTTEKGLNTHYVWPNPSELNDTILNVLQAQGAPFASLSIISQYLVYKAAKEQGYKVLLGGQGGDEVFMGYRKFLLFQLKNLYISKQYNKIPLYILRLMQTLSSEWSSYKIYMKHLERFRSNVKQNTMVTFPSANSINLNYQHHEHLWQRQMKDITQLSLPTLLRYEDANSMANSIESRLPFMDYRLVEFGLAINTSYKINKGYGKWIVRDVMQQKVPDQIRLARYKRGFDADFSTWFRSGLGQTIRGLLYDNQQSISQYIDKVNISHYFSDDCLINYRARFIEAVTLIWLFTI